MSRRGWALFAAVGIIWGVPYLFIKIAVEEVSPAMVVLVRTGVGALLLLPFALRTGGFRTMRGHWPAIVLFAALELMGPWFLLSDAERILPSSTTGLLVATVPIFGVILGRWFGDRLPVAPVRWFGLGIGMAGVALVTGPVTGLGGPWPVAEVILAALGYATAPIVADKALRGVPTLVLTSTCLGLAALAYAPVVLLTGLHPVPSGRAVLALAVLAVLCTAIAFVLFFELIGEVGAARSTLVAYVNPVVAVGLGALVLDEPVTWALAGALVLVLAGSALASKRSAPASVPRESTLAPT